jgi:AraC family transcriptional regulator
MTPANETAPITNGIAGIPPQFAKSSRLEDHMAIEVGRLLEDVRWALNCDLSAAKTSAAHLAAFLANKLSRDVHTAPARGGLAPWQKRKVRNHIEDGLEGFLPVEDLAKLVSLSPSHFCRVFKESFGESPHGYITRLRVERARTLMLTTSESLSQIALACGLADQAHLCRCFRRVTGTTPGFWRRSRATGPQSAKGETTADWLMECS